MGGEPQGLRAGDRIVRRRRDRGVVAPRLDALARLLRLWLVAAALTATVLASAGCGGSSGDGSTVGVAMTTVTRYDQYPPDTISVPTTNPGSPPCRADAHAYALTSTYFVAHSGPKAAYPADLYYVLMREELADFQVRHCAAALLGRAIESRLTVSQRRALVADLPQVMADAVRKALEAARS